MKYIEHEKALDAISEWLMKALHPENMSSYNEGERAAYQTALSEIAEIPAADVLPRDEAITMGAELAAMHGSDATSQQLEEAYLKGVEDGMTRRDVRPVVRGKWEPVVAANEDGSPYQAGIHCSECGHFDVWEFNFCPNCGAMMEES